MRFSLKKFFKRMAFTLLALILIVAIGTVVVLNLPSFGKLPSGERLARIEQSPNYREGHFQNLSETPDLTPTGSQFSLFYNYFFPNTKDLYPQKPLPTVQTELGSLPNNTWVWLGHSSYLMNIEGKRVLIDPVFHSASSFSFIVKPFEYTYTYTPEDMPQEISLLVLTHDHWDHLDYKTMKAIKDRVQQVVCPLGVGSHLEYWGFSPERITELDWQDITRVGEMTLTCLPARHFSGRGLRRAKTLWASYMLQVGGRTIFIGGDSGYDTHFAQIGKRFPSIDLALVENRQYSENWRYIHTLPKYLPQVMQDLGAKTYFAGHNSKFKLAQHPWYEPLETVAKIAQEHPEYHIITPKIGEVVYLDKEQTFTHWWRESH